MTWDQAQPSPWAVIAGRHGLLVPREKVKGMANIMAALLPDLFATPNAARQALLCSRADPPNEEYLIGVSARERSVRLLRAGDRYSVTALAIRDVPRRPLDAGEAPPKKADVTGEGVLAFHDVYVLPND